MTQDNAIILKVLNQLPPVEDDSYLDSIKRDILAKHQAGWTTHEIARMLWNTEEFNPEIGEDAALRRMRKIHEEVAARLAKGETT